MNLLNRILFLSCKQATQTIEKSNVSGLSLLEKARLDNHLKICNACNMYAAFSIKAEKAIKILVNNSLKDSSIDDAKLQQKIIKKIFST